MASADQIKALLRSHVDGDDSHFLAVAMQVAAHEARLGHSRIAAEIREIVDEAKRGRGGSWDRAAPVPAARARGELSDLLDADYPAITLSHMALAEDLKGRLARIVEEQEHAQRLRDYDLPIRRKVLLVGPPGSGKTMTAHALAGELGLPLFTVRLDGLITKYMGETIAKLRLVFDAMAEQRGVYLFDEFDSIGSDRGSGDDVGEIRRVLNAFLMYIERDASLSLIIAATNHPARLDSALHRRFDDIIGLGEPTVTLLETAITNRLAVTAWADVVDAGEVARAARGLSFSDAVRAVDEAVKDVVLERTDTVTTEDVMRHLNARSSGA